jgi:hypothetical protein
MYDKTVFKATMAKHAKQKNILLVAIFKNEGHILAEWLNHYRAQGVDHVVLIDNGSTDDYLPGLQPFLDAKYVSLFVDGTKYKQAALYNKYSEPFWARFAWLIVVDLDEFMFAVDGPLSWWLTTQVAPEVALIHVAWTMFGSSGHVTQPPSVIQGFQRRAADSDSKKCWQLVKSVIRTSALQRLDVHQPKTKTPLASNQVLRIPCVSPRDPAPPVRIYHYAIQSWQFFSAVKMTRGDVHTVASNGVRDKAYFIRYDANDVEDSTLAQADRRFPAVLPPLHAYSSRTKQFPPPLPFSLDNDAQEKETTQGTASSFASHSNNTSSSFAKTNVVPIAVGVAVGLVVCGISVGVILYMYKAKRI